VGSPLVLSEGVYSASLGAPKPDFSTWNTDNSHFGIPDVPVFNDDASGCSTPLENIPWVQWEIPIAAIVNNMQIRGILNPEDLAGATYIGGIVAGIESWGRGYFAIDIMDDHLIMKKNPTQSVAADKSSPHYCQFDTSMLKETTVEGVPLAWFKVVGCSVPGVVPAASALDGVSCKMQNRLGVFNGETYLCSRTGSPQPVQPQPVQPQPVQPQPVQPQPVQPQPVQPQPFPALSVGVYRDTANIHFETNGTVHCLIKCSEELNAKIAHYGQLRSANAALPNPASLPVCSNSSSWCK
jgi:hypothetical protein